MNGQGYRDYTLNLLAGVEQAIRVQGNYWEVVSSTGPISLAFDDVPSVTRAAGTGGPAAPYSSVRIKSTIDQTVTVGLGVITGPAPYQNKGTFTGNVSVQANVPTATGSLDDIVIPATSQVQIDPATAARIALIVQLIAYGGPDFSTYAGYRVGDSTVSASRGVLVQGGVVWDGNAAVYVYNPNAYSVTLSRQRETV